MKKYSDGIIFIISIIIILSSSICIAETNESKLKQINNPLNERGYVLFSQRPYLPIECFSFHISSKDAQSLCQDDFWNLTDPINSVQWWGLTLIYGDGWIQGTPNGMEFEIIFYKNNAGAPGDVEKTFSNITPTYTDTQLIYGGLYNLYYFETNVSSEDTLTDGWISIQSTSSPDNSWLLWSGSPDGNLNALQNGSSLLDSLAFNLSSDSLPPIPDINCDDSLIWKKVNAGMTVNGTIQIINDGEQGSLLNWEVNETPNWGTWTMLPNSGTGLAQGESVMITVEVIAPIVKKKTFKGTIKIINKDNPTDFCQINVSLETPRTTNNFTLLHLILQRYPNLALIIRNLLVGGQEILRR